MNVLRMNVPLFDTHTHFDVPAFDHDRAALAQTAYQAGVGALVLIGFQQSRFKDLIRVHHCLQQWSNVPQSYLAPGLHPFYIDSHHKSHLENLERILQDEDCVAVGEIGLDTFLKQHKQPECFAKQQDYFSAQLELARSYQKPVLLHIRKAHAETIALLKAQKFHYGGIAHAFSGGVQEAKALIKLGFKIGVTGQITQPNAKKLQQVVRSVGHTHLVIETDCPDMTPLCCQDATQQRTRNTPVNLPYVLQGLSQVLNINSEILARQIWQNSLTALHLDC